jgi:SAM-dependent methyltransferase
MLVLHHVADPQKAMREAARVLKPGGRFVLVDMLPHDRDSYRQQMGHVWLGFSEEQIEGWFKDAGFSAIRIVALPTDAKSKGPALFVAVGRKH